MADKDKKRPLTQRILLGILRITLVSYAALFLFALFFSNKVIFAPHASSYESAPDILKLTTRDGTSISAAYIPNEKAEYTILYSHGNAEDLGELLPEMRLIANAGFSVLIYDYHGYGTSCGVPSETNAYDDIDAAFGYLTKTRGVPANKIIVMGRSLGGGPSTDLASRQPVAGLILESTFASAFRVLTYIRVLPFDKFNSAAKISQVKCPVLIMHGTVDSVIPIYHGRKLLALANEPCRMIEIAGAGHDDLVEKAGKEYVSYLCEFAASLGK